MFSCPLCCEKFSQERKPRLLPSCGHSFCEVCLGKMKINLTSCPSGPSCRECPSCRTKFYSLDKDLPINYMVLNHVQNENEMTVPLDSLQRKMWCVDCTSVPTLKCLEQHQLCSGSMGLLKFRSKIAENLRSQDGSIITKVTELLNVAQALKKMSDSLEQPDTPKKSLAAMEGGNEEATSIIQATERAWKICNEDYLKVIDVLNQGKKLLDKYRSSEYEVTFTEKQENIRTSSRPKTPTQGKLTFSSKRKRN